jgi:hypothetical protein
VKRRSIRKMDIEQLQKAARKLLDRVRRGGGLSGREWASLNRYKRAINLRGRKQDAAERRREIAGTSSLFALIRTGRDFAAVLARFANDLARIVSRLAFSLGVPSVEKLSAGRARR